MVAKEDVAAYLSERRALKARLSEAIGLEPGAFGEERFNALALELFAYQYRWMARYRRLCDAGGADPRTVTEWRRIPPVATTLFKRAELFAGPEGEIAHRFSTSGTTQGGKGTSCFSEDGLAVMARSEVVNAARMLFPDVARMHILVLAPSPAVAPQMIMAWGMARLIERFGTKESCFLVGAQGLDVPRLCGLL
jgi:hypothetical protein